MNFHDNMNNPLYQHYIVNYNYPEKISDQNLDDQNDLAREKALSLNTFSNFR